MFLHQAVPIYMPIPIPIPMPMGPSNHGGGGGGGGGKYHHHHGDDHGGGGGEVKKIYLLQPMPRIQPQPHLKGGGFIGGPVQTHIHMTTPVANGRRFARGHVQQVSKESDYDQSDQSEQSGGKHSPRKAGGGHSHDSMKILPIVVIPPIAPMPPIQLPTSNSVQGARMTFTPQFNNYLVTPATNDYGDKSRSPQSRHRVTLLQDHKTFSDYGGSGGASMYKDNYAARSRFRGRLAMRPSTNQHDGSRSRYLRKFDDGDEYGDISWRSIGYPQRSRSASNVDSRRANYNSRLRANSIRDILDQQALYDEEPNLLEEPRETSYNGRSATCCGSDERRSRNNYNEAPLTDNIYTADTNLDERELTELNHHLENQQRLPSANSKVRQYDSLSPSLIPSQDDESDKVLSQKQRDSVYQDRDLPELSGRLAGSRYGFIDSSSRGKRLNLDEREILDDYEWRFDSIKSVAHASPQVVTIKPLNKTETNLTNTTTTTTTTT